MVKHQESIVRSKPTFSTEERRSKHELYPKSAEENPIELLMDILERVKGVIWCALHGEVDCQHHKVFLDEVCAGEREEQGVVLQGRVAEVGVAAE